MVYKISNLFLAWVPAEPGNRDPRANVPISKLKLMNQAADLHAQRLTRAQERRRNITRYSSETRRHDSESDAPVSSGQWPPSPESNQLPPDSSIASVDHSEGSIPQTAAYSPSRLLSRRSSHVSVLSGSMSSARPRPIVKPGSLTDLAVPSPGIVSSSNSSPSIVSTSAGEDGKPFRCRRDGCNKAYTVLGSLQRHVKVQSPRIVNSIGPNIRRTITRE